MILYRALAVALSALIELQAFCSTIQIAFREVYLDRYFLVSNGLLEVTSLRAGGSERFNVRRVFPPAQFTGATRTFDTFRQGRLRTTTPDDRALRRFLD